MGTLTLADFQEEILAGLGNRTEDDQTITLARIVRALNLAQSRIGRSYAFAELSQLAFAQMNFTEQPERDKYMVPPPNVRSIHSFVLLDTSSGFSSMGSSNKVTEIPWRRFDKLYPAPGWITPGWPQVYCRWGRFILMTPPPIMQFTAALRFSAYALPFVASVPTQSSQYDNKDDILINYALGYFFKTLGRADRAAYFENLAKEQLDEAIEKDDDRPDMEIARDTDATTEGAMGAYWEAPFINRAPS